MFVNRSFVFCFASSSALTELLPEGAVPEAEAVGAVLAVLVPEQGEDFSRRAGHHDEPRAGHQPHQRAVLRPPPRRVLVGVAAGHVQHAAEQRQPSRACEYSNARPSTHEERFDLRTCLLHDMSVVCTLALPQDKTTTIR